MVYMWSRWNIGHAVIRFMTIITGISSLPYHQSMFDSGISYDELIKLNVTCGHSHSCQMRKSSLDNLKFVNCHCGTTCIQLGTCCVDSMHRTSRAGYDTSGVDCRNINGSTLLEIEGCRSDWDGDDFVKDLCLGDGTALNDPLLLVPVSSSKTGITYRNYFCFVCNVDVDADWPVFWDLKLTSESENVSGIPLPNLIFNKEIWSWTVHGSNNRVNVSFQIPNGLNQSLVKWCLEGYTIKTCAENWTDVITKEKCESYMAEVEISSGNRYQNPHCAICNFEDLSNYSCKISKPRRFHIFFEVEGIPGVPLVGLFSLENKTIRCPRNKILDAFKNKCRAFRCGKGMVNVDGKCEVKRS